MLNLEQDPKCQYVYKVTVKRNGKYIGDIIMLEDGYYVFCPDQCYGAWTGMHLQELSSTLYEMNKEWDDKVKEDLNEGG